MACLHAMCGHQHLILRYGISAAKAFQKETAGASDNPGVPLAPAQGGFWGGAAHTCVSGRRTSTATLGYHDHERLALFIPLAANLDAERP